MGGLHGTEVRSSVFVKLMAPRTSVGLVGYCMSMVDWLVGWLVGFLAVFWVVFLVGCLIWLLFFLGCFLGWLCPWLFFLTVFWLFFLGCWLVGCFGCWLVMLVVSWLFIACCLILPYFLDGLRRISKLCRDRSGTTTTLPKSAQTLGRGIQALAEGG